MKIWINGMEKEDEKDCLLARLINEMEIRTLVSIGWRMLMHKRVA